MDINYYRKCKNIRRLQGTFIHREYNLLEHQYMVAVLFKNFASIEDISFDFNVFDKILHHDILEVETTDLIYTVKNFNEKTKQAWQDIENEILLKHFQLRKYSDHSIKSSLTENQFELFKVCDLLDLWIFCKEEKTAGNNNKQILEVISNCENLILNKFDSVTKFINTYEF